MWISQAELIHLVGCVYSARGWNVTACTRKLQVDFHWMSTHLSQNFHLIIKTSFDLLLASNQNHLFRNAASEIWQIPNRCSFLSFSTPLHSCYITNASHQMNYDTMPIGVRKCYLLILLTTRQKKLAHGVHRCKYLATWRPQLAFISSDSRSQV